MAVTRCPVVRVFYGSQRLEITNQILPHILRIVIEDIFDNSGTVSKLEIEISSKFNTKALGFDWEYRDILRLEIGWTTNTTVYMTTNAYYLDFISDNRSQGRQTYTLNMLDADLSLGFTYGGKIIINDKTTKQLLTEIKDLFNLQLTENITDNVYVGTIPIPNDYTGGAIPGSASVSKEFKSYAEAMIWIASTYGYFLNISGTNLTVVKIQSTTSFETDFAVPRYSDILDFSYTARYTDFYKTYQAAFSEDSGRHLVIMQVTNSFNIANKNITLQDEGAYYNRTSGQERAYGRMYADYIRNFKVNIKTVGDIYIEAGKKFYLGDTYGQYAGFYRTLRVIHEITHDKWISNIEALPLNIFTKTSTAFISKYLGSTTNVVDITVTQTISGNPPVSFSSVSPTRYDDFAKSLNSNYNLNLGSDYILFANADAIRSDIAFCQALVETGNFTYTDYLTRFNPGGIGGAAGENLHTFPDWSTGIRAHIQHLFAYAKTTGSPSSAIVDPRYNFVTRGTAPTVNDLQGRWTSQQGYSNAILEKLRALYLFLGFKNPSIS